MLDGPNQAQTTSVGTGIMGLGKQAKTLNKIQIKMVSEMLMTNRYGLRDQTIFYFSIKAGLRAKEIAHLKWAMVMNSDSSVGEYLHLPNSSSKGRVSDLLCMSNLVHASATKEHDNDDDYQGTFRRAAERR